MKIKNTRAALSPLRGNATPWWKSGIKKIIVCVLMLTCSHHVHAKFIAGSSTSTLQISTGGNLRTVNPDMALDLGGGTLFMGDDIVYLGKTLRAPAKKVVPKAKSTKLATKEGTGTFAGIFASIMTVKAIDSDTILGQPISGNINTFIDLDGQTSTLAAPLSFSVGVYPYNGSIDLHGQSLTLNGPLSIAPDSDTLLIDAHDMNINNNINLNSTWTFDGDGTLTGNGGILDLSGGGVLAVHPYTSLSLHNFVLRGVESGSIVLFDTTSEVRFSNMVIELSDNYTVTTGGLYIDGPTMIVTADKILTLSQAGSMTVDHVSLQYDTLSFPDQHNITPVIGADRNNKHVIALRNGVIRQVNAPTQGSVRITTDTALDAITVVHPNRTLIFDESATLDGATLPLVFSQASVPLVTVAAGKNAVIKNTRLEYFSPSYLSIGAAASLVFGDATAMALASDHDLSMTMTFKGQCSINGNNHTLSLGAHGGLMLGESGSSLLLENMVITGVHGTKINTIDNTCTFSLNNVRFVLDGNYVFPTDRVEVLRSLNDAENCM